MANNYSIFSEAIDNITKKEAAWIQEFLGTEFPDGEQMSQKEVQPLRESWLKARGLDPEEDYIDMWPYFTWSLMENETRLWLYSEEGFDLGHLAGFVQAFLKKFRPDKIFKMTAAEYCDKPRIGEFGGLWAVIGADSWETGGTWTDADKASEKLLAKIAKKKGKK